MAPLTLILQRDSSTKVEDPAGRWQYERGRVSDHGTEVGFYASTEWVTNRATEAGNGATIVMTVFFAGRTPLETITLQGAGDVDSGSQAGSVSAASAGHAGRIGRQFRRAGDSVTIE